MMPWDGAYIYPIKSVRTRTRQPALLPGMYLRLPGFAGRDSPQLRIALKQEIWLLARPRLQGQSVFLRTSSTDDGERNDSWSWKYPSYTSIQNILNTSIHFLGYGCPDNYGRKFGVTLTIQVRPLLIFRFAVAVYVGKRARRETITAWILLSAHF